jgi:GcrA cell cycle regulator
MTAAFRCVLFWRGTQCEEENEAPIPVDWTEVLKDRLRKLWDSGASTPDIARALGISKNAVVGKAHRLKLVGRPSPIIRDGTAPKRVRPPQAAAPKLLPIVVRLVSDVPTPRPVGAAVTPPAIRRPPTPPRRPAPTGGIPYTPEMPHCCQFPLTDRRPWMFCGGQAPLGSPWCEDHRKVVWVRSHGPRPVDQAVPAFPHQSVTWGGA